jgi:hypothetical protein
MRFKRVTFSWKSPLLGVHVGCNPASGQRFVHVAPFPFVGLDFELPPYGLNEGTRAAVDAITMSVWEGYGRWIGVVRRSGEPADQYMDRLRDFLRLMAD